jgi:hypothetical protein
MSQNSRNQGFYYYICLMIEGSRFKAGSGSGSIPMTNGSGSGRPKNTSIRWIRIRNTGSEVRDTGSRKNLFRIPDPGDKKAPDTGSGSATLLCTVWYCSVNLRTIRILRICITTLYLPLLRFVKNLFFYFADMEAAWSPLNPSDRTISPLTWPSGPLQLGKHIFFFFFYTATCCLSPCGLPPKDFSVCTMLIKQ